MSNKILDKDHIISIIKKIGFLKVSNSKRQILLLKKCKILCFMNILRNFKRDINYNYFCLHKNQLEQPK